MSRPSILDVALEADANGLCAIPAARTGTKQPWPDATQWAEYQLHRPTVEQLRTWFTDNYPGIGLVCGKVSGGLEMLEFEGAAVSEGVLDRFEERARDTGLLELVERIKRGYEECTPSGGIHWLYRCENVTGNIKLARRPHPTPDNPHGVQVLIETRGEGGFTVIAPSSGPTHPTGDPWVKNEGGLATIATITADERDELHRLCATFDRMPVPTPPDEQRQPKEPGQQGRRPGEDYNDRATWDDVLRDWSFVYRNGEETAWRRPGKDHGVSAIANHLGTDTLKVFSTSTPFDTGGTYTKFGAYAVLNHSGDHDAAARELYRQGFGDRIVGQREQQRHAHAERYRERIFRGKAVEDIPPPDWLVEDMLSFPGESVLYAPPKTGKSFLALDLALSVATGLPFMLQPTVRGVVLYVAAEGIGGLGARVHAWRDHHTMPDIDDAYFMTSAVNLSDRTSVEAVADLMVEYQPILVVFDTLARCTVGIEENSAKDIGLVMENVDRLRDVTGGHIMLVHHSGKDTTRGMRGSSAILGAVDTTIELQGDTASIHVVCTAQKDAAPFDPMFCALLPHQGSAVIHPVSAGAVSDRAAGPVLEALMELADEDRTSTKWLEQALEKGVSKSTFNRTKKALIGSGQVLGGGGRGALYTVRDEYPEVF